jgi:hypothetical protein
VYQKAVCNIFKIAKEYTNLFPFQGPPKFTQIGIFENEPSGNPATYTLAGFDLTAHRYIARISSMAGGDDNT